MLQLIENLTNAFGVSGNESEVRNLIIKEIEPHIDEIDIDKMGNLICHHKGKTSPVILAAHMDEIGLMVHEIDEHNHIHFSLVGDFEKEVLLAQQVHMMADGKKIHGVITYENLHVGKGMKKFPETEEMYVDTGLTKNELKQIGIKVGTYIVPERKFIQLGSEDVISGKAFDDRLGCAILIELAKRVKGCETDIYFVFTVQEEIGLYGAKMALSKVEPMWGLAIDCFNSEDYNRRDVGLNKGPVLIIKDSSHVGNRHLINEITGIAERKKIQYQTQVSDMGTTDAFALSLSRGGMPAAVVAIPIRNLHSTISIAHMKDVEKTIMLLEALLKNPPRRAIE